MILIGSVYTCHTNTMECKIVLACFSSKYSTICSMSFSRSSVLLNCTKKYERNITHLPVVIYQHIYTHIHMLLWNHYIGNRLNSVSYLYENKLPLQPSNQPVTNSTVVMVYVFIIPKPLFMFKNEQKKIVLRFQIWLKKIRALKLEHCKLDKFSRGKK